MVRKRIDELTGKEIAAENITNNKGFLIIPKGSLIKKEYLPLLQEIGIETVCIYEEGMKNEITQKVNEFCVRVKKLLEMHVCGMSDSLKEVEEIAAEMWESFSKEKKLISVENRTKDIYEHTIYVTILVILMSKELNMKFEECRELIMGSILHDIGLRYISVPFVEIDPENMTPENMFQFRSHTVLGYTALEKEEFSKQVKELVLFHHEKKDGSGYPLKKKNLDLPFQILQCANEYDGKAIGLVTKAETREEIIEYFESVAGVGYDQEVIDALLSVI